MEEFSDIALDHFMCPRNMGIIDSSNGEGYNSKGKTIEEAIKITEDDVVDALGGLPDNKKHCSNLGVQALKNAIQDYYGKEKN